MASKPKAPHDDPEQSKRFIETAKEIGAAEDEEGADRALKKIVLQKGRPSTKKP